MHNSTMPRHEYMLNFNTSHVAIGRLAYQSPDMQ